MSDKKEICDRFFKNYPWYYSRWFWKASKTSRSQARKRVRKDLEKWALSQLDYDIVLEYNKSIWR